MKLYEVGFRDLYKKVILMEGKEIIKNLKQVNISIQGLQGALFYGYVDHEQGMLFELLALKVKVGKEIEYRIAPKEVSYKLSRKDAQEFTVQLVENINYEMFKEKIELVNELNRVPSQLEELRDFQDLDISRHTEFPDDVIVYLLRKGFDPEAVWVRLESFSHGKIEGTLLVKPKQNFGYTVGDSVLFQITEMEDQKLACVSIIE